MRQLISIPKSSLFFLFPLLKFLDVICQKIKKNLKRFLKQIDQIGKKHHALFIKLQPFLLQNQKNPHYSKDKSPLIPTKTIWIDLSKTEKQLLKKMGKKVRYSINFAKRKGIKTKMRVKLAVKMLVIAWTLMKKKEVFDPDHLNID